VKAIDAFLIAAPLPESLTDPDEAFCDISKVSSLSMLTVRECHTAADPKRRTGIAGLLDILK
jgi:hypothetical protein